MARRAMLAALMTALLALSLARPRLIMGTLRIAAELAVRTLQLVVLAVGAGSFWWVLRSYQLALEQELFDQALQRFRYYRRYRTRTSSGGSSAPPPGRLGEFSFSTGDGMLDAGFQLRVLKRLPITAHLRTSWGLPDALSEEIAVLTRMLVKDYVGYWFSPISPSNEEFPHDVKFLIADLLGAIASRLLEIDSSQALTMVAKGVELFRMHLGWFREAYAQLAEEYPEIFDAEEESDENLAKRQEYVRAYVQRSQFVHPGCLENHPDTGKKCAETAEALYLRHLATQLLVQLKPQFGQQYDTNLFVSIAVNLLREITAFKILKPLTEYAQPRYANEIVVASLGAIVDDKDVAISQQSQTFNSGIGAIGPRPSLNKLRMTGSFLYKASRRSSETAEAAFQALVDAVSSAATTATTGAAEAMFDGDEWSDTSAFTFGSSVFGALAPQSTGASGDRKTISSLFSLDERISLPKAPRLMTTPRNFISSGSSASSAKSGDTLNRSNTHLEDLKNVKANIGSSLNSSLGKVKKRFRTLSGHPNEQGLSAPPHSSSGITGTLSSNAAARMIRKPGQLFQKAWKRNESGHGSMSPGMSMGESFDDLMTPPTTPDGESRIRSNARIVDEPFDDNDAEVEEEYEEEEEAEVEIEDDEQGAVEESGSMRASDDNTSFAGILGSRGSISSQRGSDASSIASPGKLAERVVLLLDKTVTNYTRMFNERPEMRSSARSRELYELLSALEDVLMLGYQSPSAPPQSNDSTSTRASDLTGRVSDSTLITMTEDDLVLQSPAHDQRLSSPSCFFESDPSGADLYYYWNYLAQDRPGISLLNEHWRFIATRCPPCCESDSFVSTRGVQWLLVALEKGLLWEFFTGLRLHTDMTEQFYDEFAVLSDAKRFDSVLKSLRQLNSVKVSLEIPTILGRKSEMDQEFGVSPTASRSHASSPTNNVVRVLESVWETERYVPIQGWVKAQDKRRQELPSSEWVWEGEWMLEKLEGDSVAGRGDSSDSERGGGGGALGGSWEYAKTFEDRFHEKEKKFDSVRRRKWIRKRRQLPPVLVMALSPSSVSPLSPSFTESSKPDAAESTSGIVRRRSGSGAMSAMNGLSKARRLKNRIDMFARDKADKLEKAAKAKAGRPLVKRRSQSFDKSCPTSPISTPALATLNAELDSFRNAAAALEGAADGTNITSNVRRKSLGKAPTHNSSGILSREISSQMSGYEDDVEDNNDDDLCFRCLKALPPTESGICQSCHQRVCAPCHNFFAFTTFPPPLESTKKCRVCGNCYDRLVSKYKLRMEAHVGKYLIKEKERELPDLFGSNSASDSAPAASTSSPVSSPTGSSSSNPRFEVTMRIKGESAYAWTAVKTFHDFELLEKELSEKLKKQEKKLGTGCKQCHWKGIDYAELLTVEPSLRKLPVAALSYEKRLYVLEEFLQSLLACDTLGQSSAVQKFLLLTNVNGGASASASGGNAIAGQARDGADTASAVNGGPSDSATGSTQVGSGPSSAASGSLVMENGKWKKGRWIAPDANSKETKMRVLQKMEVSLFAALSEVFEFDGIGAVRRHLFSVTRSFIKAFLSASHFRMLERQVLSLTEPKKLAAGVHALRDYMFPPANAPAIPPVTEPTADEMRVLRAKCRDALFSSFPSKLVSLMGESACANAALKVHDFLQHEVMVKNLLFSLADELLLHLFPEASVYKLQRGAVPAHAAAHSAPASPSRH